VRPDHAERNLPDDNLETAHRKQPRRDAQRDEQRQTAGRVRGHKRLGEAQPGPLRLPEHHGMCLTRKWQMVMDGTCPADPTRKGNRDLFRACVFFVFRVGSNDETGIFRKTEDQKLSFQREVSVVKTLNSFSGQSIGAHQLF